MVVVLGVPRLSRKTQFSWVAIGEAPGTRASGLGNVPRQDQSLNRAKTSQFDDQPLTVSNRFSKHPKV